MKITSRLMAGGAVSLAGRRRSCVRLPVGADAGGRGAVGAHVGADLVQFGSHFGADGVSLRDDQAASETPIEAAETITVSSVAVTVRLYQTGRRRGSGG